MAIKAGPTSTGLAIASGIRGGSNSLASKGFTPGLGKETSGFSSVVFINPRGEAFSKWAGSIRSSDAGVPNKPILYEPLRPRQLNELGKQLDKLNQNNSPVSESLPKIEESVEKANPGKLGSDWGTIRFSLPEKTPVNIEAGVAAFGPKPVKAEEALSQAQIIVEKSPAKLETAASEISIKQILRPTSAIGFAPDYESRNAELIQIAIQRRIRANNLLKRQSAVNPEYAALPQSEKVEAAASSSPSSSPEVGSLTINKVDTQSAVKNTQEKMSPIMERKRSVRVLRKANPELLRRKKYAKRDWEMDQRRLRLLTDKYEAAKIENGGGEVDGAEVAGRSSIGSSRMVRSIFLDQRGYYDRADGTQKRIELMLAATRSIDKSKLRDIIDGSNALKEDEDPNNAASQKQVDEVINRPDVIQRDYEPVEVVAETIVKREEVKNSQVLITHNESVMSREVDLEKVAPEINLGEVREGNIDSGVLPSRFVDTVMHNIGLTLNPILVSGKADFFND